MAMPDTQSSQRLHPDEDLRRRDGVSFQCKFEGTYPAAEAKGIHVVQRASEKMREGKSRRKESGVKQAPMVSVHISVQGIEVFSGEEVVTKTHLMKVPIEKISYIARDPADRHYLAIVYETSPPKAAEKAEFECTLFKHDINKTRDMVLTLNQAFDLAYEMRVKEGKIPKVSLKEQVDIYRSRLKQLSEQVPADKLNEFLRLLNITEVTEIRGVGGDAKAPHTMVTQPSEDATAQPTTRPSASGAATATVAASAAATTPAKPLLQTASATSAAKPQPEVILDFDTDQSWAPVQQQQTVAPPPSRPAPNPFPQQQQQQQGGFNSDSFFGAPFVPPTKSSAAAAPSASAQQQQQQQDLMRLGFGPMDADFEFDPLKTK
ncbi:hypothetical protein BOX15_Mlig022478g3 [Macrostomum lignano]|uniref:PID domain-containing protein n=1 Tax=Macrostomum lignano TaxID=282301 RepID=A0A267EE07_9PLAT|nr:hypothetical protein BOX15_Mlig022478g3 [Macrostomum lignano]